MSGNDYIVVGAGLSGAVVANELSEAGKKVTVFEAKPVIGGAVRQDEFCGDEYSVYGPHIFNTSSKKVYDYVSNKIALKPYYHVPLAIYQNEAFTMPIGMQTLYQIYGEIDLEKAMKRLSEDAVYHEYPENAEDYALAVYGKTIYEKLIKHYTEKQWGVNCADVSADILRRLNCGWAWNRDYYGKEYCAIPDGMGYNELIEKLLARAEVFLEYKPTITEIRNLIRSGSKVIYTGSVDELYNYSCGTLEWRTTEFSRTIGDTMNMGVAVVNFTDDRPDTRMTNYRYLTTRKERRRNIVVTETPRAWREGKERYYPINTKRNQDIYEEYKKIADEDGIYLLGRLGTYKYINMDMAIMDALGLAEKLLEGGYDDRKTAKRN